MSRRKDKKKRVEVEEVESEDKKIVSTPWTGTGSLLSLPQSRDVKIDKFSVALYGIELGRFIKESRTRSGLSFFF